MHRQQPKRKSRTRFQHCNTIVDEILPTLPNTTQAAALFVMFRHANEQALFRLSVNRLAKTLRIHRRTAQRTLDELEAGGVIKIVKERQGTIPRQYKITGFGFASGGVGVTTRSNSPPEPVVALVSPSGGTGVA